MRVSNLTAHNAHQSGCALKLRSWYVLRVKPNAEKSVERALARQGFGSFLPAYSETVRWSDRVKRVSRLLFPGYVFVHASLVELPLAFELAGILGALPSNLRPSVIPDAEIESISVLTSQVERALVPVPPAIGDQVTVKAGPMKGAAGVVVRDGAKTRLVVSVAMLGRAVSVELAADDLERVQ